MDVVNNILREVVVDDGVDRLEVDAASHQVCRNQHPNLDNSLITSKVKTCRIIPVGSGRPPQARTHLCSTPAYRNAAWLQSAQPTG